MKTYEDRKRAMILSAEAKRNDYLRDACNKVNYLMKQASEIIEESNRIEYSGDVVLLKRNGETWESLGVFNPKTMYEDDEPLGWDLCLPIPKIETVREFQGF